MTGFLTVYMQNKILAAYLNAVAPNFPSTVYIGLATSIDQATGAVTGEPTIGTNAYARVSLNTGNTTIFATPSAGASHNVVEIRFPTATNTGWTGTLTKWFISDASTAGNTLMFGTLGYSLVIGAHEAPVIPVSTMTLDGSGW